MGCEQEVGGPRLTFKDISLLKAKSVASCEEAETGVAEDACCYRHCIERAVSIVQ